MSNKENALGAAIAAYRACGDAALFKDALQAACEAYLAHRLRVGHGTPFRPVIAPDGTHYASLGDAARAHGCWPSTIHTRAKKGLFGWRFA